MVEFSYFGQKRTNKSEPEIGVRRLRLVRHGQSVSMQVSRFRSLRKSRIWVKLYCRHGLGHKFTAPRKFEIENFVHILFEHPRNKKCAKLFALYIRVLNFGRTHFKNFQKNRWLIDASGKSRGKSNSSILAKTQIKSSLFHNKRLNSKFWSEFVEFETNCLVESSSHPAGTERKWDCLLRQQLLYQH